MTSDGRRTRIVVVGGGSQFAVGLCESFVDYGRDLLAGAEVVLHDINEGHLASVHEYARRLADAVGIDMTFTATPDRREAFRGADHILTTFRPGTHEQQLQDETVPPRHGLQGNETVGIGGIFMACRVAPVLREICADAEELCPNAWIINYTNPTQYVADTVRRISRMRVIALCDGFVDVIEDLAYLLGVPPQSIVVHPAGTNHSMWIMRFTVAGEDGYPLLRRRLDELSDEDIDEMFAPSPTTTMLGATTTFADTYKQFVDHYQFPFSLRLFRLYGLLPGPRYYWRYLLEQDSVIEAEQRDDYVTMAGYYLDHTEPSLFSDLEKQVKEAAVVLAATGRDQGGGHGDLAVRVIASMVNDLGEQFVVNVPNRGAVPNLPTDAILELSATVDRNGAHPFAAGPMPKALLGLQHSLVLAQELAVDAALSGSREDLLRAIVAHPLIHSVERAEACMDELLELQAEWLPQFSSGGAVRVP